MSDYTERVWLLLHAARKGDFSGLDVTFDELTCRLLSGGHTIAHVAALSGNLDSIPEALRTPALLETRNARGETVFDASRRKVFNLNDAKPLVSHDQVDGFLEKLFSKEP